MCLERYGIENIYTQLASNDFFSYLSCGFITEKLLHRKRRQNLATRTSQEIFHRDIISLIELELLKLTIAALSVTKCTILKIQ